jgi:hypothetical protein
LITISKHIFVLCRPTRKQLATGTRWWRIGMLSRLYIQETMQLV